MGEPSAETLIDRVESKMSDMGMTARELSIRVTGKPDLVRDMRRRGHAPSTDNIVRMAQELGVSVDWLLGYVRSPEPVSSEVGISDRHIDWKGPDPTEPGIPLVGTGDCADIELSDDGGHMVAIERSSFDPEYHVRMIARPPALRGTPGLYAIYFHGESMVPRFEPGDVGIVDPTRPPRPGEYVLVQLTNGSEDEVVSVLVKRLVRATSSELLLEQFNPAVVFSVPRARVARYHRILQQTDLLL